MSPTTTATRASSLKLIVRDALVSRRRQLLVLAPVFALAVWASGWVTVSTAHNVQAGVDSASYLGTANEIRSGHGPTVPSTYWWDGYSPQKAVDFKGHVPSSHFPPGYSVSLAAVSAATGQTRSAARVIDIVCIFVNVVLLGVLTARMTAYRSAFIAAVPAILVLFVPDRDLLEDPGWLTLHIGVFSEPLFMVFATGALLATCSALGPPSARARRAVVVAAALAAAALFTCYVGAAVVFTVAIALVAFGVHERIGRRLRRAIVVGSVALLPLYLFLFWSIGVGGRSARLMSMHAAKGNGQLVDRLERYFFPVGWPSPLATAGVALIAVLAAVVALWLPPRARAFWSSDTRGQIQYRIAVLFIVCFIIVVFISRTYFDALPFSARLLAPMRGVGYAVAAAAIYRALTPYVRPHVPALLVGLAVAGLVFAEWSTERFWLDQGAGRRAARTTVEQMLSELPADAVVVTNVPDIAYLNAERATITLPAPFSYLTRKVNPSWENELEAWVPILAAHNSYAFLSWTMFPFSGPDDLRRHMPIQLPAKSGDEELYKIGAAVP